MAKKYIVGIDFGHGETAAWVVPIVDGTGLPVDGDAVRLKATNVVNDRVLPSVVFRASDGEFQLNGTLQSAIIGKMKRRVSYLEGNVPMTNAYRAYIKLVVEAIIKHNSILTLHDDDDKPNFYMCMASPTNWSDKDKDDYLNFFNEAVSELGIEFEWIINESDAAFFSHRDKVNHDKVTLVIDYGSSTIDYTVMYQGKKVSSDQWSNPQLGAGNIEHSILDTYRQNDYDSFQDAYVGTQSLLVETNNAHIDIEGVLNYKCRQLKEDSYTSGQDSVALEYHFGDLTGLLKEFRKYRFEYDFTLSDVTAEYRQMVQHDFEALKSKIKDAIGRDVDCVILSGGACIMNWVTPMVKRIFEGADIVDDRSPSFVVARGIALYAKAQHDALEELLKAIAAIDFATTYRKADVEATKKAIEDKELSKSTVAKIRTCLCCIDMVKAFNGYIEGLNHENAEYVSLVRAKVKTEMTDKVRTALAAAFLNHFKWKVDTSSIEVDVDVDCTGWNPEMFTYSVDGRYVDLEKTGVWSLTVMKAIENIFERNTSFYVGVNWTKVRTQQERDMIADSIVSDVLKVLNVITLLDDITYGEDNQFLVAQAASIKQQALEHAERLFYESQLFRTTFSA